jgi:hypothetical protein
MVMEKLSASMGFRSLPVEQMAGWRKGFAAFEGIRGTQGDLSRIKARQLPLRDSRNMDGECP